MIARREGIALGLAGTLAVAMPLVLLTPGSQTAAPERRTVLQPLSAPPQPTLAAAFSRSLFGAPAEAAESPQDAPALVGIVGRLDQDAVALVRTADGTSRTLKIGESVDGWRLASLAIDAAFFTRGTERVRVALPTGQ
jgi:hypothetical protein